jgi:hypothetical protein
LVPYDLTNPFFRKTFLQTRDDLNEKKGLLCFSGGWSNPVIWAHYSDKHRGMCLGFEIPEIKGSPQNDETDHVDYQGELLTCPNFDTMTDAEYIAFTRKVLFTKFKHWVYEDEIRIWGSLQDKSSPLNFVQFGENLRLIEVIVGAKSALSKAIIKQELGSLAEGVNISKARAAYNKFEMVEDEEWA